MIIYWKEKIYLIDKIIYLNFFHNNVVLEVPLSRDIVSPHKTIRGWISLSPRMESTGIEYPP